MVIEATAAEYNRIANGIRLCTLDDNQRMEVALSLASTLADLNRRFKPPVFLRACGVQGSDAEVIRTAADFSPVLAQRLLVQVRKGTES